VSRPVWLPVVGAGLTLGLAAAACGSPGAGPHPVAGARPAPTATTASPAAASPTATPTGLGRLRLLQPASRSQTSRAPRAPHPATPSAPTCVAPSGVRASQVVVVRSSGSSATIRACRRSGSHYLLSLGPYAGHVGLHGVSADKREGDLRTPAGVFSLLGGFGRYGNPGLDRSWFTVDSRDVWVDDSSSALYNTHQRSPAGGRWTSAEPLDVSPVYDYAQVIGYNDARTPGRGSAIFLHVDHGGGTEGCVSVPAGDLLAIMRWEGPSTDIAIS
jgi:L,D-peptidoglycan transpeptidase YkuD (ErfK/YbiS/YcfS/YnhG family)